MNTEKFICLFYGGVVAQQNHLKCFTSQLEEKYEYRNRLWGTTWCFIVLDGIKSYTLRNSIGTAPRARLGEHSMYCASYCPCILLLVLRLLDVLT